MPDRKPAWRERKTRYIQDLATQADADVLLVSACDKLHNLRSIIADLRTIGPALSDRFSQSDPASQLWYYQSLTASCQGRIPAALAAELQRELEQLRSVAEAPT